ncbi:MAG: SRPBCC family protein [Myxococcota bacterium]
MPQLQLETLVDGPVERVFDLSRNIDLHCATQTRHREMAVAGVTHGLIGLHQEVTWEATHLGVRQRLTSRITMYDRPHHFRDSQVSGAFARFDHDHFFEPTDDGCTRMRDLFDYDAPLGPLGRLADWLFLERYMTRLLEERNAILKEVAGSERWRDFIG